MQIKITIAIIIAHILTGTASVSTRYLVAYLEPVEIAFLRYLFGSMLIFLLYVSTRTDKPSEAYFLKSIALGIIFFALFPFLFSTAFDHTTAARGALVIATMPVWSIIIGHLSKHEKMNPGMLASVTITISGLVIALMDKLSTSKSSTEIFTGELIMLCAALVGAIYSILAKSTLKNVSAINYTPIMMMSGFLFLSPWAASPELLTQLLTFNTTQLLVLLYLGFFAGGIAFFLFNWVLSHASATYTTMFVPLNPITASFLAWLLLNETLSVNFIVGSIIVFTGLIIGQKTFFKRNQ